MGYGHRRKWLCSRIVARQTYGRDRHKVFCRVVAVNGQILVRMAIQAVGRVGACCDGGNDFRTRAAVTGGTSA